MVARTRPIVNVIRTLPFLLILETHHPDTQYLRERVCGDPWLFSKPKGVRQQKCLGTATLAPVQMSPFISKKN